MRRRYVASKRHTIQVDYDDYMRTLRKERDAGAERASGTGTGTGRRPTRFVRRPAEREAGRVAAGR
jgi:hypothetical protein